MTAGPRVVLGMPAYRRPDALVRTLESLVDQTYRDFALVIVDDGPSPDVTAIVEPYASTDPRIAYEPNANRLGMVGNWRKAFERARERFPQSEYFAWVSDHDVWHPRWLEVLVSVLDGDARIVMAYPHGLRMYPHDRRRIEGTFDTTGVERPLHRLRGAMSAMTAGNAVYGLFRASALAQAGGFRAVLLPDRQVLAQLSLLGEFAHVPQILWYREASGTFGYARQREMCFPARAPLHTYLPADLQHAAILLWDYGVRGLAARRSHMHGGLKRSVTGRPSRPWWKSCVASNAAGPPPRAAGFGRLAGVGYACALLWYSLRRDKARWKVALRRTALGRTPL